MISPDRLLPDVIREHPGTREVFDRYGLRGCGGASGPPESIEFFARVHAVPLDKLLAELEAARNRPAVRYAEDLESTLYRRHFRTAIVMFLGVGSLLGVTVLTMALFRVGGASLSAKVQAHADVQIFGWIGLFVMGFACQGLPRFKYVRLSHPRLAGLAFALVTSGVVLRAAAMWPHPAGYWITFIGGLVLAAGVSLFVAVMWRTLRSSSTREPWDLYVKLGLAVFLAGAWLAPLTTYGIYIDSDLVPVGWLAPWRDGMLLGFGGFLVLGVAQRILPPAFGFGAVGSGASRSALALLVLAMAALVAGGFGGRFEPSWVHTTTALLYGAGAAILSLRLGAWTRCPPGRSTKFLRAAWIWLGVAVLLLLAEGPLFVHLERPAQAWHSAFRHAFALGFLSLAIAGVSLKVVPILRGADLSRLPPLTPAFVAINAGLVMRVGALALSEFVEMRMTWFTAGGAWITFAGFAVWGVHLWRLLSVRPAPADETLGPDSRVAEIAERHPESLEIFDRYGFQALRNPLLRATIARGVTVRTACSMKGVDMDAFLRDLRARTGK